MKKFLVLSFLGIAVSTFALYEVNVFDFHHLLGSCSGSNSYCNVCKNCNYCGNCAKNGGTCAVCYTPRTVVRRSTPRKTYRSENSVSSNNARSIQSNSPAVKRYYLRKSTAGKYSSSGKTLRVRQQQAELLPSPDKSDSDISTSSINEDELVSDPQPVSTSPIITEEGEIYTIDIPENADFVRITAASANLRELFSTKSRILQKLKHGDLLIKLKAIKGWVKVQTLDSGEVGYVSSNLLQ